MSGRLPRGILTPLPKINSTCLLCGTEFYKQPSQTVYRPFCSRQHWYMWITHSAKSKVKREPVFPSINSSCAYCGTEFYRPDSTRKSEYLFCDKACFKAFGGPRAITPMKVRVNDCGHPERIHISHGMCGSCYFKWKHYGLTTKELIDLKNKNGGECYICSGKTKRMHIDHDHITGIVRGYLCSPCNTGLGHFKDSKELLARAIVYLG